MNKKGLATGLVHDIPEDIEKTLISNTRVRTVWEDITPIARNEWICWIISVKKPETRRDHIRRFQEDLLRGKCRPCCWAGCIHR